MGRNGAFNELISGVEEKYYIPCAETFDKSKIEEEEFLDWDFAKWYKELKQGKARGDIDF